MGILRPVIHPFVPTVLVFGSTRSSAMRPSRPDLTRRGPTGARQTPRLAQRLRGSAATVDAEHDGAGRLRVDPPASVHYDGSGTRASPQAVADQLAFQPQLGGRAGIRSGLRADGNERTIRDADGGQTAGGTQMHGQTGPTRMVA